jgi:hypothetical protein
VGAKVRGGGVRHRPLQRDTGMVLGGSTWLCCSCESQVRKGYPPYNSTHHVTSATSACHIS